MNQPFQQRNEPLQLENIAELMDKPSTGRTIGMHVDIVASRTAMKRLVRHQKTRAYLGKDGEWTKDLDQLQHFDSIQAILSVQRRLNLTDIEVVLQMGEDPSAQYDVALPLGNS